MNDFHETYGVHLSFAMLVAASWREAASQALCARRRKMIESVMEGTMMPVDVPASGPGMLDPELLRAQRVASRNPQPEDISWLCKGFAAFLASGGKLPLERCLRLPANERSLRRSCRDHWLREAWLRVDAAASSWRRSERLAVEVQRFQSGKWARWSLLDEAPASASAVEAALFQAFKSHERVPGTAMQIHNIAGQCRA
jgi:hypothetical protein